MGLALLFGIAATFVVKRWAKRRQDATGQPFPTIWAGIGLIPARLRYQWRPCASSC